MTNEEKLKQAMNIVLRGNDIESAKTILEAVALDNYKLVGGRVNHFRIAVRQILNYIEETQNKDILDVTREKVVLKEELKKQDNRIKELEYEKENYQSILHHEKEKYNQLFLKYQNIIAEISKDFSMNNTRIIVTTEDKLEELKNKLKENEHIVNLQSNKKNVDTQDFRKKYQCEWNLKSNKESGEIDEC